MKRVTARKPLQTGGGKTRILVVEPIKVNATAIVGLLSDVGYEARAVSNCGEALSVMPEYRPHIAIVELRTQDGVEDFGGELLIPKMKKSDPALVVIVASSHPKPSRGVRADQRYMRVCAPHVNAYIVKSADPKWPAELLAAIERLDPNKQRQ